MARVVRRILLAGAVVLAPAASWAAPGSDAPATRSSWSRLAAESWLSKARALAARGDTAAAMTAYTDALRADPTLGDAYFGLAEIRRLQGDMREAERLLTRAVAMSSARAEALSRRAELYRSIGRMDDAVADWRDAADLEPTLARLRTLAQAYVERRAWVAALSVWRRIRSILAPGASVEERRDADETVAALAVLSAEADAAQHDAGERSWVRKALRRHARR